MPVLTILAAEAFCSRPQDIPPQATLQFIDKVVLVTMWCKSQGQLRSQCTQCGGRLRACCRANCQYMMTRCTHAFI
eukprot:6350918-Amphidinium_carterae.1